MKIHTPIFTLIYLILFSLTLVNILFSLNIMNEKLDNLSNKINDNMFSIENINNTLNEWEVYEIEK